MNGENRASAWVRVAIGTCLILLVWAPLLAASQPRAVRLPAMPWSLVGGTVVYLFVAAAIWCRPTSGVRVLRGGVMLLLARAGVGGLAACLLMLRDATVTPLAALRIAGWESQLGALLLTVLLPFAFQPVQKWILGVPAEEAARWRVTGRVAVPAPVPRPVPAPPVLIAPPPTPPPPKPAPPEPVLPRPIEGGVKVSFASLRDQFPKGTLAVPIDLDLTTVYVYLPEDVVTKHAAPEGCAVPAETILEDLPGPWLRMPIPEIVGRVRGGVVELPSDELLAQLPGLFPPPAPPVEMEEMVPPPPEVVEVPAPPPAPPAPPPLPPAEAVRISLSAIVGQFPSGALAALREGQIAGTELVFSREEMLSQAREGAVYATVLQVCSQLPQDWLLMPHTAIAAQLPVGKFELPLSEVIAQIPPEVLAPPAERVAVAEEIPELFEEAAPPTPPPPVAPPIVRPAEAVELPLSAIVPQFPTGALIELASEQLEGMLLAFSQKEILEQMKEGAVYVPVPQVLGQLPSAWLKLPSSAIAAQLPAGKFELPLAELVGKLPPEALAVVGAPLPKLEEMPEVFVERAAEVVLPVKEAPPPEVPLPPPTEPAISLSLASLASSLPEGTLTALTPEQLASKTLQFPLEAVVERLREGAVAFPVEQMLGQLPPEWVVSPVARVAAALPEGKVELPLAEVVAQLPPEAIQVTGPPRPMVEAEMPDVFVEPSPPPPPPPAPAVPVAPPAPAPAPPVKAPEVPAPVPPEEMELLPVGVEEEGKPLLELEEVEAAALFPAVEAPPPTGAVVKVALKSILKQLPPDSLMATTHRELEQFNLVFPMDEMREALSRGAVRVPLDRIISQLPEWWVNRPVDTIAAALIDGCVALPTDEVAPQVGGIPSVAPPAVPGAVPPPPSAEPLVFGAAEEVPDLLLEEAVLETPAAPIPTIAVEAQPEERPPGVTIAGDTLISQLPPGSLRSVPPDALRTVSIRLPVEEVLDQLAEGMVHVPVEEVLAQIPRDWLVREPQEIARLLPSGRLELPIAEVASQIPSEVFAERAKGRQEVTVHETMPDLFGPTAGPEAPPHVPVDMVQIRFGSIVDQLPPGSLSAEALAASEFKLVVRAADVRDQLAQGAVAMPAGWLLGQLPTGWLLWPVQQVEAALRRGEIELPLEEIVRELPPEYLAGSAGAAMPMPQMADVFAAHEAVTAAPPEGPRIVVPGDREAEILSGFEWLTGGKVALRSSPEGLAVLLVSTLRPASIESVVASASAAWRGLGGSLERLAMGKAEGAALAWEKGALALHWAGAGLAVALAPARESLGSLVEGLAAKSSACAEMLALMAGLPAGEPPAVVLEDVTSPEDAAVLAQGAKMLADMGSLAGSIRKVGGERVIILLPAGFDHSHIGGLAAAVGAFDQAGQAAQAGTVSELVAWGEAGGLAVVRMPDGQRMLVCGTAAPLPPGAIIALARRAVKGLKEGPPKARETG